MNKSTDSKLKVKSESIQSKMVLFTDASNLNDMCVTQVDIGAIVDQNSYGVKKESSQPNISISNDKLKTQTKMETLKKEQFLLLEDGKLKHEKSNNLTETLFNASSKSNQIFCFCGQEFETYLDCKIHHTEAHEIPKKKNKFECVLCNKIFDNDDILNKHMLDVHYITSKVKKDVLIENKCLPQSSKNLGLDNKILNSHPKKLLNNNEFVPTSNEIDANYRFSSPSQTTSNLAGNETSKPTIFTNKEKIMSPGYPTSKNKVVTDGYVANVNSSTSSTEINLGHLGTNLTTKLDESFCPASIDISEELGEDFQKPATKADQYIDKHAKRNYSCYNSNQNNNLEEIEEDEEIFCLTDSDSNSDCVQKNISIVSTNSTAKPNNSIRNVTLNCSARSIDHNNSWNSTPNHFSASLQNQISNPDIIEVEELAPEIISVFSTTRKKNESNYSNLKQHQSKILNTKPYNINTAKTNVVSRKSAFNTYSSLENSQQILRTAQGGGICKICGSEYLHYSSCKTHYKEKHGENAEKKYFCPVCKEGFTYQLNLTSHLKKVHFISTKLYPTNDYGGMIAKTGNGGGVCLKCCKQYQHYSSCKTHFAEKHLNNCLDRSKSQPIMDRFNPGKSGPQQVSIAKNPSLNGSSASKYNCQSEIKSSSNTYSLPDVSGFNEIEEFLCTFCVPHRKFSELVSFEKHHSISHSCSKSRVTCNVCQQKCSDEQSLSNHMLSIHGIRNNLKIKGKQASIGETIKGEVVCMVCGQKFMDISSCKKHMKQHEESVTSSEAEIETYDTFVDVSKVSNSSQEKNFYQTTNLSSSYQAIKDLRLLRAKSQEQNMGYVNENPSVNNKESMVDIIRQIKEEKRRANSEG